ncbi:AAA family ATPase [Deinococcus sp. UYEF24]
MTLDPARAFYAEAGLGALLQDRRAAAVVALLAIEGPMSRSRLAGLLWPEVLEATARNNLSQTLRRIRQNTGSFQIGGDGSLHLLTPLDERSALTLIQLHDYSDLGDLSDLLLARQEQRRAIRLKTLRAELDQAQRQGDLHTALDLSAVLLDLDPLHEDTQSTAMRLYHLLGDRTGGLDAYHRYQRVLLREMGLTPSPEIAALAREIERSSPPPRLLMTPLPLSVQRPPRLIGRETTWEMMRQVWEEGRGIILSGEPGVGKTRLMQDFVIAHGGASFFSGRPGDRLVPYSTHARTYSALMRQYPALDLPGWVRRELARIVPELGEPPPPLASDIDKLRFYQAKTEVLKLAARAGMRVVAFDDLQFVDEASAEAGEHSLSVFWGDSDTPIRTILDLG